MGLDEFLTKILNPCLIEKKLTSYSPTIEDDKIKIFSNGNPIFEVKFSSRNSIKTIVLSNEDE